MTTALRVLVLEDSEADFELLAHELGRRFPSLVIRRVEEPQELTAALREPWDIVISDWSMPRLSAPQALEMLKRLELDIPLIIVSGTVGEETAVEAMRSGAKDFLLKGRFTRLIPVIERELKESADRKSRRNAEADLRRTEAKLRQAQKLEAVGRLARGVAHEINTPAQFVNDSLHFVREALQDLTGILRLSQRLQASVLSGDESGTARADALAAREAMEGCNLAALLQRVPKALDRSLEGLARITSLVRSLKDVSDPEFAGMAAIDLNRAIESAIAIAQSEYHDVADVQTEFAELPLVMCHVGDINQVMLNILMNAAHAIQDVAKGSDQRGRILVSTKHEGDEVVIAISDTGGGIPLHLRDQIFGPFLTTKEIGRGTGKGLAISHAIIVDKHKGALTFDTHEGKGTTFVVRLPLEPTQVEGMGAPSPMALKA